eukprot:769419_1
MIKQATIKSTIQRINDSRRVRDVFQTSKAHTTNLKIQMKHGHVRSVHTLTSVSWHTEMCGHKPGQNDDDKENKMNTNNAVKDQSMDVDDDKQKAKEQKHVNQPSDDEMMAQQSTASFLSAVTSDTSSSTNSRPRRKRNKMSSEDKKQAIQTMHVLMKDKQKWIMDCQVDTFGNKIKIEYHGDAKENRDIPLNRRLDSNIIDCSAFVNSNQNGKSQYWCNVCERSLEGTDRKQHLREHVLLFLQRKANGEVVIEPDPSIDPAKAFMKSITPEFYAKYTMPNTQCHRNKWLESSRFSVDKVYKLSIPKWMNEIYEISLESLRAKEMFLFHGCRDMTAMDTIARFGFDRLRNQQRNYGYGTYLAVDSSLCIKGKYCAMENGFGYILLCKAICDTKRNKGKPNQIINTDEYGVEYNSLDNAKAGIYSIYRDYRVIPIYIIRFKIGYER